MEQRLIFEVLSEDELLCRVDQPKGILEYFTEDKIDRLFCPRNLSEEELQEFLRDRCFPETRVNKKQVLMEMGVPFYDPYLICRVSHGMFFDDTYWVRFPEDNNMSWKMARKEVGLL